jgi:2-polyprenyl-3-methyl-5-hydroxy-6-metoxy-1,4-benzoquinol methylase
MIKLLSRIIKKILFVFTNNLEGKGERVEIDFNKPIDFNNLNMYQKSHYKRYEFALDNIFPNSITGDFACGTGYGSIMLSKNSEKVIGIDLNDEVINKIKKRYSKNIKVEFLQDNLLNLNYDSYFNNIISFETVEHLREDDIEKLFKLYNKSLKTGGKLIFSTPYLQEMSENALKMGFHLTFLIDEIKIKKWLENTGFDLVSLNYQNYDSHFVKDDLSNKDFIICIAIKR